MSFHIEVLAEPLTLYRVCKATSIGDEERLLIDLRSNYEKKPNKPPYRLDAHATVIHMGLSFWGNEDSARRMSHHLAQHLGEHIARLHIEPDYGVCVADTGPEGHFTVWGRPGKLLEFVQDVVQA